MNLPHLNIGPLGVQVAALLGSFASGLIIPSPLQRRVIAPVLEVAARGVLREAAGAMIGHLLQGVSIPSSPLKGGTPMNTDALLSDAAKLVFAELKAALGNPDPVARKAAVLDAFKRGLPSLLSDAGISPLAALLIGQVASNDQALSVIYDDAAADWQKLMAWVVSSLPLWIGQEVKAMESHVEAIPAEVTAEMPAAPAS